MRVMPRHAGSAVRPIATYSLPAQAEAGNMDAGPRPFRVLGVQQIAIGAESKDRLLNLWSKIFGIEQVGDFQSASENVDEAILQVGKGPAAVEIDLMQPLDPAKKPAVHIPPLNHIGLWVDDIEEAVSWLQQSGVRFAPGGIRVGASGHKVCFIHPKANDEFPYSGEGILIELVQAPQAVVDFHDSLQ